jgi:iron complex transport system substrate-binding protein
MSSVQRIVSLVPSITEILYFLGLEERVFGVTDHCNFPEEAKTKEKVGTFGQPQISRILSLKPDLVLADGVLHKKIIEELQNAEVKVLASTPSRLDDIFLIMSEIGRFCDIESTVRPIVNSLKKRVLRLSRKSTLKRLRGFHLMSINPFVTPGPGSIQYDALRIAGVQLMDFQSNDSYVKVSLNQIKEFDPEVILFCGVEKGQTLPPKCIGCVAKNPICQRTVDDIMIKDWEQITAVRENRVYPIPCHTLCRPGPRLVDGMEKLHSLYFQF